MIQNLKMGKDAIKKTQTGNSGNRKSGKEQELQMQASPTEYKKWKRESQTLKIQ